MKIKATLAAFICAVMLLNGCASSNRVAGGFLGALAGGVIGGIKGGPKGLIIGALAGGAAGYAAGWLVDEYTTTKTKTPDQVAAEHNVNVEAPPEKSSVYLYDIDIKPESMLTRGKSVPKLVTTMEVVCGSGGAPKLDEHVSLVDPDGNVFADKNYPLKVDETNNYIFSRDLKPFPAEAPQGLYAIKSTLYCDGVEVDNKESTFQLVKAEDGKMYAYAQ